VKQHHYNSKGHYLIYVPQDDRDRRYQIVFETDGQRVVNWRFGKVEEVNWGGQLDRRLFLDTRSTYQIEF
jgi:hypothetical protein